MADNASKQTIYLFTTTARELYRRDLLNVCCFPEGWRVEFGYKKEHVPDDLISNHMTLGGSPVVIVYCEPFVQGDVYYRYHPVRRGTIVQTRKDRDDSLTLTLELVQAFDYISNDHFQRIDSFQPFVNDSMVRPRTFLSDRMQTNRHFYFVRASSSFFQEDNWQDWGVYWSALASYLGTRKGLDDSLFMRFATPPPNLPSHRTDRFPLPNLDRDARPIWRLTAGSTYEIRFEVKTGANAVRLPPVVTCHEDLTNVLGPFERQCGDGTEVEFLIIPKRLFERDYSIFVARVPPTAQKSARSPEFSGILEIAAQKWLLPVTLMLLVGGSALLSIDSSLFGQWFGNPSGSTPQLVSPYVGIAYWVTKSIGAALLALGGYFGFRKLPIKA